MSFLYDIFNQLKSSSDTSVLQEIREDQVRGVTGSELLALTRQAREFLAGKKLTKGDRCALLAHNSIEWVAMDLATMAEGLIVVPLYARQAPAELVAMMKDCSPALVCCGDAALRDGIAKEWSEVPARALFDDIFATPMSEVSAPTTQPQLSDADPVTIIYTSGTSGEAKGVILTAGNIGHMLGCVNGRLNLLMAGATGQDRVFHYLPFVFAGSWMSLMTSLLRGSLL